MNISDCGELWDFLTETQNLSREKREQLIMSEVQKLDCRHLLADLLEQHFHTSEMKNVPDTDFDSAATLAWILIQRLRKAQTGAVH